MQNKDLFAEQVEQVAVFVFDSNHKYMATCQESGAALKRNGYKMVFPYTLKDCVMVTWAGKTDQYYALPDMKMGDSIEKLTLIFAPNHYISNEGIDPIWYSGPAITTFAEDGGFAQTVNLIRDTNDITFKLKDRAGKTLDPTQYEVKIQSPNGGYDYRNNYLSNNPILTHFPHSYLGDVDHSSLFRMMRLVDGDNALLSIIEKKTGRVVSIGSQTSINLIDFFAETVPNDMSLQEYLDRRYEWDITLNIDTDSYLAVCINVNGWIKWFDKVDM